jgi:hypothetical protein
MQVIEMPPLAHFTDRFGKVRPIAGCSVIGRFEFADRCQEIERRLAQIGGEGSVEEFYDRDAVYRHLIDECFRLNGIDLNWVSLSMIDPFLFCSGKDAEDKPYPGWLVLLNQPASSGRAGAGAGSSPTLAETIAMLSFHTESVSEALHIAQIPNGRLVIEVVEQRSALQVQAAAGGKRRKPPTSEEAQQILQKNAADFDKMHGQT